MFGRICWCRLLQQRLNEWNSGLVLATDSDNCLSSQEKGDEREERRTSERLHEVKVRHPLCASLFAMFAVCLLHYLPFPSSETEESEESESTACIRPFGGEWDRS